MGDAIWQLIIGGFIVAVVFMLVRPGAPAADAVTQLSNALSDLVGTATEYSATSGGNSG